MPNGQVLKGDGTWFFTATIDGNDIVVRHQRASWFGGDNDPTDNGLTASGAVTRNHPDLMGCALPLRRQRLPSTKGSPIPPLPWNTMVRVWSYATNSTIEVPVIDLGPHKATGHAIDLTEAAFRALGVDPDVGITRVDFRILNGANLANAGDLY